MRRTRHVVLPVRSWQYIGLMVVSLACLTLGLVSRDREGKSGSLAGPELTHTAPHEIDICPNELPFLRSKSASIEGTPIKQLQELTPTASSNQPNQLSRKLSRQLPAPTRRTTEDDRRVHYLYRSRNSRTPLESRGTRTEIRKVTSSQNRKFNRSENLRLARALSNDRNLVENRFDQSRSNFKRSSSSERRNLYSRRDASQNRELTSDNRRMSDIGSDFERRSREFRRIASIAEIDNRRSRVLENRNRRFDGRSTVRSSERFSERVISEDRLRRSRSADRNALTERFDEQRRNFRSDRSRREESRVYRDERSRSLIRRDQRDRNAIRQQNRDSIHRDQRDRDVIRQQNRSSFQRDRNTLQQNGILAQRDRTELPRRRNSIQSERIVFQQNRNSAQRDRMELQRSRNSKQRERNQLSENRSDRTVTDQNRNERRRRVSSRSLPALIDSSIVSKIRQDRRTVADQNRNEHRRQISPRSLPAPIESSIVSKIRQDRRTVTNRDAGNANRRESEFERISATRTQETFDRRSLDGSSLSRMSRVNEDNTNNLQRRNSRLSRDVAAENLSKSKRDLTVRRQYETNIMNRVRENKLDRRMSDYKNANVLNYLISLPKYSSNAILRDIGLKDGFLSQALVFTLCAVYTASLVQGKQGFLRNIINPVNQFSIW